MDMTPVKTQLSDGKSVSEIFSLVDRINREILGLTEAISDIESVFMPVLAAAVDAQQGGEERPTPQCALSEQLITIADNIAGRTRFCREMADRSRL